MATSNTVLRIAELDFDTIKNNLKDYLRSQSTFTDYDFEGSGLNILLDILAYNTHYMAYYLNMVGNEMFLDSAVIRNSVISHAKNLNYMPSSARAATAIVDITITDDVNSGLSTYTIPKYTQFQSQQIDGTNYTFVTLQSYNQTKNLVSNTFTFSGVELKQGERLSYNVTVTADNTKRRFIIPSENIDTTSLEVSVQTSSLDTSKEVYSLYDDVLELTGNSKVYFLEEDPSGQYAIYFGDGYIGKNLADGNIVQLNYIDTSGEASNKANSFTLTSSLVPFSNVVVTSVSASAGGAGKESIERIKFTAPKSYTTQNRAVTVNDYGVLLLKDYPNVESISVWGGEDNDPIVYGKVFISMKPKSGYIITDLEKDRIIREIIETRNVLSITPEIVDPNYLFLKLQVTVDYDSGLTINDENTLKQIVKNTINLYNTTDLEKFNSTFRVSKLENLIVGSDSSFLSSHVVVIAQKRFEPTLNESKNYTIDFNVSLNRGTYKDKLTSYPSFQILDNAGISRDSFIEETPLSFTGVDSINVLNSGSGYSDNPTVTITGDGSGATARAVVVNGKITSIRVINAGSDYTSAVISITDSTGSGATASAVLSGNIGTLRIYYILTSTGEKVIINSNAGRIDYSTGRITLFNFNPISISSNPNYASGVLTINVLPDENIIYPLRNRLLSIDSGDPIAVQVTMENEA